MISEASSASGLACLVFTIAQMYNLIPPSLETGQLDESNQETIMKLTRLSSIARLGSGSACRSIFGGFVKWEAGVES